MKMLGKETDEAVAGARAYLTTVGDQLSRQLARVYEQIVKGIEKFLKAAFGIDDIFGKAGEGIKDFFDKTIMPFFEGPFMTHVEKFGEQVKELYLKLKEIWTGGDSWWEKIKASLQVTVGDVKKAWKNFWKGEAGKAIKSWLWEAWTDIESFIKKAANTFVEAIMAALGEKWEGTTAGSIGKQATSGKMLETSYDYWKKKVFGDVKQVTQPGLIPLSKNDVVLDRDMLGSAIGGEKGSAIPDLFRGMKTTTPGTTAALPASIPIEVTVKITGDMLSDEAIRSIARKAVTQGIVASGKSSLSIADYEGSRS